MVQTTNVLLGGLTINEIGYDQSGAPGFINEFIELINLGSTPINLNGVQVWDGNSGHTHTFGAITIPAGQRLVLLDPTENLTAFQAANPGIQAVLATFMNLNNIADELALVDTAGNYIVVRYNEPGAPAGSAVTTQPGFPGTTLLSSETINLTTVADGQTVQRSPDGDTNFVVNDATIGIANVCFAPGTLIATEHGETVVEDLAIGDMVMTAQGALVEVRWIGRQTVKKGMAGPRMQPVRIRAGALGDGLPHTDLVVTADHGMILDDLVINASALVNGTSIEFVPMKDLPHRITYYHVETENHEVILANNAPAETFVDYVGRQAFDNYAEYLDLYGAERIMPEMNRPRISAQRLVPDAVKARLGIEDEVIAFDQPLIA